MPGLRNGLGSMYLGSKDQHPDGSFVTTEWLFILIPIIPVKSMRVAFFGISHGLFKTTKEYIIIEKLSLDWQQVFLTYFLVIATFFLSIQSAKLFCNFFDKYGWWSTISSIIGFVIPIIVANQLFFEAKPR